MAATVLPPFPRPGQGADNTWVRTDWAPLATLTDDQLADFNTLHRTHRLLKRKWESHDFYQTQYAFFHRVLHQAKRIEHLKYAYCIGLGSLMGHDTVRDNESGMAVARRDAERLRNRETRLMQLIVFQTWVAWLNQSPYVRDRVLCPEGIEDRYVSVQEMDYHRDERAKVDMLFLQSFGYQARKFPDLEVEIRITAPYTFLYAPYLPYNIHASLASALFEAFLTLYPFDVPETSLTNLAAVAAMHGNAFAFPGGGVPLFCQNKVTTCLGRWKAALKITQPPYEKEQKGTWIYKKIGSEYVGRAVFAITKPSSWPPVEREYTWLKDMHLYWRLDKDADFQVINLASYDVDQDETLQNDQEDIIPNPNPKWYAKNKQKEYCENVIGIPQDEQDEELDFVWWNSKLP